MKSTLKRKKIDEFGGRIDLGLVDCLGLAEHGRGIQRRPPRSGGEIGGLEKNRRALLPGTPRPVVCGPASYLDRLLHLGSIGQVRHRKNLSVVVRFDCLL